MNTYVSFERKKFLSSFSKVQHNERGRGSDP